MLTKSERKTAVMPTEVEDLIASKWARKQTNIIFALEKKCIDEQQAQVLRDHAWKEYKDELSKCGGK